MTRSWKVYWKLGIIFITTFFATSVCSQTKRFRSKDQIWWSLIRGRKVAIPEDCGLWAKENGKVEKRQDLATVVQKNVGSNDKSCAEVVGALGTVPLRLKGNNLKHLNQWYCFYLGISTVVFCKDTNKSAGDMRKRQDIIWFPLATCCCSAPMNDQLQYLELWDANST